MKKITKKLFSLVLVISLFASFSTAHASNTISVPDCFNPELEKQKLHELATSKLLGHSLNSSSKSIDGETIDRIFVSPNEPLVITFEDGSSITYTASVTEAADTGKGSDVGTVHLSYEKHYSYMFGYAKIKLNADNTTWFEGGSYGKGYIVSTDPNDIYQDIVDTGFATVTRISAEAKNVHYNGGMRQAVRAKAKGDITYTQGPVTKQQTYEFIFEVNPDSPETRTPFLVSVY